MNLRSDLDLQDDLLRREEHDFDAEFLVDVANFVHSLHSVFIHWDSVEVGR
jgi:hypothetical protein